MRILYIGSLVNWGTCISRMRGLIRLGHEVVPVNTESYISGKGKIFRIMHNRLLLGPGIISINRDIIQKVKYIKPDIIWVDKGIYFYPRTIKKIKELTKAVIIHHNTDDILNVCHKFSYYLSALDFYDAHYSSNIYNVNEMRAITKSHVKYNELGYDDEIFKPIINKNIIINNEITFIGHWEKNTENHILELVKSRIPVHVRGPGWLKLDGNRLPKGTVLSGPVFEKDYVKALCACTIGLGIVSVINRNKTAGRIFEIPACGIMLLAVRNDILEKMYTDGKEVVLFSSVQELIKKSRYYLSHKAECVSIAEAGRKRLIANKCTWKDRVEEILDDLKNSGIVK